MRRSLFSCLLALLMATFLVVPALAGAAKKLSLLMVDWNQDVVDSFEKVLIPKFEKENPGYTITVDWTDWGQIDTKLTTAFAAGIPPDVFQSDPVEFAPKYYLKGQILDLDPFVAKWGGLGDFYEKAIQRECYFKGKLIAIPYLFDNRGLFYRKDFFQEVGLNPASPPRNWDELRNAARKLTIRDASGAFKRAGFYNHPAGNFTFQHFVPLLWQNNGRVMNDTLDKAIFDSPEGIQALEFWVSMVRNDKVAPTERMSRVGDLTLFVGGQSAMGFYGYGEMLNMSKYNPDHYKDIGITVLSQKQPAALFYANTFHIAKRTKDPNDAWKLLEFLLRSDNLGEYLTKGGGLPPTKKLVRELPWVTDLHRILIDGVLTAKGSDTSPAIPTTIEVMTTMDDAIEKSMKGVSTPAEALRAAAKAANEIIQRYGPW